MSFNPLPTALIASWSEDGTNVTFPISSLPEMTATEADATVTGDSRKVIYALMERMNAWFSGLATADKPGKLTISRSSYIEETTGNIIRTYTVRVITAPSGVEVVAE